MLQHDEQQCSPLYLEPIDRRIQSVATSELVVYYQHELLVWIDIVNSISIHITSQETANEFSLNTTRKEIKTVVALPVPNAHEWRLSCVILGIHEIFLTLIGLHLLDKKVHCIARVVAA